MNPVLIAGAGPTGLVLALWLTKAGVKVRLVDKADAPGTTSRAMVVHARTLELYAQLGIAEEVVKRGIKFEAANLWVNGEKRARIPIGDMGKGASPYPYVLVFPQDRHEKFLVEELARLGVQVERGVELLDFTDTSAGIRARLRGKDGAEEEYDAPYLAGCDGARSVVRSQIGAGFPGGTYPDLYYVADVVASGPVMNQELNIALDEADFVAVFPMQGEGAGRFVGEVLDSGKNAGELRWNDVSPKILRELGIEIKEVRWFSSYHVHHRVAATFRRGRAFLLGDAGHIHSPVGGQGMNTGIGDAVNLGWKLAEVLLGRAPDSLLDSYEPERIAFARKLVATTDGAFRFATARGPLARFVRREVIPRVLPFAFGRRLTQRLAFRTISQTGITYRGCHFNSGHAGALAGGDRLPWTGTNFAPLASRTWQVHLYGDAPADTGSIPLHRFPFDSAARSANLAENVLYLVRPDGYLACIARDSAELEAYRRRHGLA